MTPDDDKVLSLTGSLLTAVASVLITMKSTIDFRSKLRSHKRAAGRYVRAKTEDEFVKQLQNLSRKKLRAKRKARLAKSKAKNKK